MADANTGKTYYRVRLYVGGWQIVSKGNSKVEANEAAAKAIQDEHGGLWEGIYLDTQLSTYAQLKRRYKIDDETLAEWEYRQTQKAEQCRLINEFHNSGSAAKE